MVDTNIILSRVTKIRACTAVLRRYGLMDPKSFLRDTELRRAEAELAIQTGKPD